MWPWAIAGIALQSVIFAPIGWWPLAFICLTPWLILTVVTTRAPRVYFYSFVIGLTAYLINMRWLYVATGWGYLALALYQAAYFPLVACPVRHAVRRRRWPLALVFPLVWTGSELIRAVAFTGFPWFFLSHSFHRALTLIQISDLVGAYGVSFVVAAANGAIADAVLRRLASRGAGAMRSNLGGARASLTFAGVLLLATIVYGQVQLRRATTQDGPKVAVIQGDYFISVDGPDADDRGKMRTHIALMDEAAKQKPDLVLLPETPWIMYLNPEARDFFSLSRDSFRRFRRFIEATGAYLVTGSASLEQTPDDLLAKERRYNSATVFAPEGGEPGRYDKVHLVPFGEVVPFRFGRLRPVYLWLNSFMPFGGPGSVAEYSLFAGRQFNIFSVKPPSQPGKSFRFGVPICYEDVMPYVARAFVCGGSSEKRVDFLLNISNDGWYGRGAQQPQHLAICVFRAVENRVGIARAVTTGVSAFIDPTGRVRDKVTADSLPGTPGESGFAVAGVKVDSRYSLYSRYGDWFAWGCAAIWLLLYVDYWIARARAE
jgi:apolipoprotein N-acyltransferase